ncbi:MAG TPA: transporter substrate-binding domain-containing protein [Candidatus Baltobacteraceae bacterium]|nr:transporter substrate-binding domain-containing protein [Candidatus Baltobacteraceae bacterium]
MQRKRFAVIQVAVMLLVAALQAHAGTLEAAKQRGALIVGVRKDFPPLGYIDGTGQLVGFEVDLARYLARHLLGDEGKLQVQRVQAGDRITSLLSGSIDMLIAGVMVTDYSASVFAFSEPYLMSGSLLLVRRGSSISDFPDVVGKKVAVIEGSVQEGVQEGVLGPAIQGVTLVKFWSVSAAVEALRTGQVDAFAEDDVLVWALARQYPQLAAVGNQFRPPHPVAVAVRKDDQELLAWVNGQLQNAKADGTYDTLWKRYFGEGGPIPIRP